MIVERFGVDTDHAVKMFDSMDAFLSQYSCPTYSEVSFNSNDVGKTNAVVISGCSHFAGNTFDNMKVASFSANPRVSTSCISKVLGPGNSLNRTMFYAAANAGRPILDQDSEDWLKNVINGCDECYFIGGDDSRSNTRGDVSRDRFAILPFCYIDTGQQICGTSVSVVAFLAIVTQYDALKPNTPVSDRVTAIFGCKRSGSDVLDIPCIATLFRTLSAQGDAAIFASISDVSFGTPSTIQSNGHTLGFAPIYSQAYGSHHVGASAFVALGESIVSVGARFKGNETQNQLAHGIGNRILSACFQYQLLQLCGENEARRFIFNGRSVRVSHDVFRVRVSDTMEASNFNVSLSGEGFYGDGKVQVRDGDAVGNASIKPNWGAFVGIGTRF